MGIDICMENITPMCMLAGTFVKPEISSLTT